MHVPVTSLGAPTRLLAAPLPRTPEEHPRPTVANSNGRRHTCGQLAVWRSLARRSAGVPSQRFAWAGVEFGGDRQTLRNWVTLSLRAQAYAHTVLRVALNDAMREEIVTRNVVTLVDPPSGKASRGRAHSRSSPHGGNAAVRGGDGVEGHPARTPSQPSPDDV